MSIYGLTLIKQSWEKQDNRMKSTQSVTACALNDIGAVADTGANGNAQFWESRG